MGVRKFVNSSGLNELLFFGESLARIFYAAGFDFQRAGDSPDREAISSNAGASQNPLLGRTQLFKLHLVQLLQRFWYTLRNFFHHYLNLPFPLKLPDSP